MKKSIIDLGKVLNKQEQINIKGSSDIQLPACTCNYSTGRWSHPICGNFDCREIEIENPIGPSPIGPPIDLTSFCLLNPTHPLC
ncbi:hypothetical protein [uncultured Tenacibaculum sp.]|uniref:hypothetical protein n=1 Tax=uncultured Tenacibaculum sp. TaxID=174713 RepID=UPI00260A6443|nr:hypothetical protein [uncultured Tenacibaculum sp.]